MNSLPYKIELKPFEKYVLYKGMEINEPTLDYPVEQYISQK